MKKQIITVAILATMLASCSNNEVYDVVNTSGNNPISFTNLNDKVSRSANDNKSDYKVYATSTLAGENSWFIDDVVKDDNSVVSGSYFWPASPATVDFYAWAPATVTAKTPTYKPLSLSIDYTVPAAANQDFTIAAPIKGKDKTYGTVAFQFSHMLSKISVSAELTKTLADAGYLLSYTSAELKVGSTSATIDPTIDAPEWTSPNSSVATYVITKDKSGMIMPQASTGCTIQLKDVTITKGGAEIFSGNLKVYTILADDVSGNNFVKSKHYNLKFTIDANAKDDGGAGGSGSEKPVFGDAIRFTADVADWTTKDKPAVDVPVTQP